MLQINVSQMLKALVGTTRSLEVADEIQIMADKSKVMGLVRLTRTNRGVLASASLNTAVTLQCCRCLNDFSYPTAISFEEEYFPAIDVMSGMNLPEPEEPESFTLDEHHVLDLTEAVRQYALLTIPMKPLCRENCGGIRAASPKTSQNN